MPVNVGEAIGAFEFNDESIYEILAFVFNDASV
jgi:hypothetical protein